MKKIWKKTVMFLALALALILPAGRALADWDDELVVVITETQQESESTQSWLAYLKQLGVPVRLVAPAAWDSVKTSKYLALMATPGDPALNGDILPLLVDEQDVAWLSEPGNRKFYYLDDKFAPGQTILLFAGSSQRGADTVRQNSRDDWEMTICGWFDIVISSITLFGY